MALALGVPTTLTPAGVMPEAIMRLERARGMVLIPLEALLDTAVTTLVFKVAISTRDVVSRQHHS
jgi:hypothetical protein